jgi:uncharacterized protein YjbI with pentapeptide repeats
MTSAADIRERLLTPWRHGEAHDLRDLDIADPLDLSGCVLSGFDLSRTRFRAPVDFSGARLEGLSWFTGVRFDDATDFTRSMFLNDARFDGSRFAGPAVFSGAEFRGIARFDGAHLDAGGDFSAITSYGNFAFDAVRIKASIEFTGAELLGGLWANRAHFEHEADFASTQVHGRLWLKNAVVQNHPLSETAFDLSFGYTYK